ncbi:TRAP transporter permease [Falsiroseomonas sp.]|uniref:TRAP transporter permease n=1 Tax=Falsiroseomonas sp. TaxID=2870721 RepID=UPI002724CB6F|nr:TRAP transporter permease [Falsiroseomonas sp.]MDO9501795.1 TRAP transporter permease [Falsiroseomonas sp.]MDP3415725.1 TRAP transporter permease [Falsiroseomonas sp.]
MAVTPGARKERETEWRRPTLEGEGIIDVNAISAQSEVHSETRRLVGRWALLFAVVAIGSSLFHFYTAGYRPLPAMEQRPVHVALMLFLCFLIYPATKAGRSRQPGVMDLVFSILGGASAFYVAYTYQDIVDRGGFPTQTDIIVGSIFCVMILEAARRTMGMFLIVLAAIFLGYLFVGPWMPGILGHGGFTYDRVIRQMYMTTEGVFGIAIGVSATYVYLFILFGAFLQKSGTTTFFTNIAFAAAGHSPGGPAKVGVLASALMGTIQGSSAANVASTGVFTIPLMKRLGFSGYYAGAVEAVASCGGQFLPPVMGASAFIMAEYLQMPYAAVAAGALLPALLYYGAVYLQVHLRARKVGMEGLPRDRLPKVKAVLLQQGHLVLPIFVLIGMLMMGYTALFAAFFSIVAVVVVSSLRRSSRMSLRDILEALEIGARNSISTAIACAAVGFIVGSVGLTGVGLLFTQSIIGLAAGMLLPALLLAAACSLFLSFGLPTTSVYIITATLVAPSLIQLGVPPLVAHLFCYYWGGVSAITPPVALAAYVAAGIANAPVMKTGFTAMRLGMAAYLVPFIFVYWPALVLWHEMPVLSVLLAVMGGLVGVFCMGALGERYLTRPLPIWKMGLLAVAIVLVMHPAGIANFAAVGIALFVGITEYLARPAAQRLRAA